MDNNPEILSIELIESLFAPFKQFYISIRLSKEDRNTSLNVFEGGKKFEMKYNLFSGRHESIETVQPFLLVDKSILITILAKLTSTLSAFPISYSTKSQIIKVSKSGKPERIGGLTTPPPPPLAVTSVDGFFNFFYKKVDFIEKKFIYIISAIPNRKASEDELLKVKWGYVINEGKFVEIKDAKIWIKDGHPHCAVTLKSDKEILKVSVYAFFKARSETV